MTILSDKEKEAIMADMKSFDEPMPAVGIFWYDPEEHDFFGVYKKEVAILFLDVYHGISTTL